jgi:UDPglucose 6-dehydrogenase
MATVAVWGAWHLGSVMAAGLASLGHHVLVTDASEETLSRLASGVAPVREPGLDELIAEQIAAGTLEAVPPTDARLGVAEFSILAADVEVGDDDVASLETMETLVGALASVLASRTVLIVMSQIPVGTSHRLARALGAALGGPALAVATMPENLRLGGALEVFFHPDRLVVGADDPETVTRVAQLFSSLECPTVAMSVVSAEMSKHALNAYLATSISFMSQLSDICEAVGANAWDVALALRSDARVGPRAPVLPGLGFAGGTLGRDLQYLLAACREQGVPSDLIDAVVAVNQRRLQASLERVDDLVGGIRGRRICLLGLTYKPGTSTLRRSQAVELGRRLAEAGGTVVAHDPMVAPERAEELGFCLAADPYEAAAGADVAVLMTPWPEYRELDWLLLGSAMAHPVVFDPGAFLDSASLSGAGFAHVVAGRPSGQRP